MSASKLQESAEVRIAHSLNMNEEEFVDKRRGTVLQSLMKLKIPCKDNVPNIALLGSGGGQRAMVGLLGSLVQLKKAGHLDYILYLSGVSGSTWCMASIYQEPDWSTKLETVKDKIIKRISGPAVSWGDAFAKLKKYYYEKDLFSLTDVWAVMAVTTYVKEIDENNLSAQFNQHSKDPFPIYTVIDKQCKQRKEEKDCWFEISPYEAGYSLPGAFVKTSSFGSEFNKGSKEKPQDEMDMLYLQALCGSALADGDEIRKFLWQTIIDFFKSVLHLGMFEEMGKDPKAPPVEKCYQVLMDLANMNLSVLNGKYSSDLDQSIRTTVKELSGGKSQLIFSTQKLDLADKHAAKLYMKQYTEDLCNNLSLQFSFWPFNVWTSIYKCMVQWIWGRKYDFLYNVTNKTVPGALLESKMRDYEDAGLLLNSPYFSVLRKERKVDLIISLDFSDGDPFKTVMDAADECKKQGIPFPEVILTGEDPNKPKNFYVFKGDNTPTVIHIPLFNVVNCGENIEAWRTAYTTLQGAYSAEKITDLMEVAGKNISDNIDKLLKEIGMAAGIKRHN